ncbi:LPS assembly protein LptD [Lysobacter sp. CFH 32150]|nr:LPS assembly protein LptD [Lysobacter sp. CFH 32150]MCI4567843.1 LPS assembly protein LptD [Lysobacter sp. CFH 32150]
MPDNWSLCPVGDAVPAFPDAPVGGKPGDRASQPTDIEGDQAEGVDGEVLNVQGNVALKRGDQFLGADKLRYDSQNERYVAEGNIRYQDSSMRLVAERAEGDQAADEHQIENLRYQLVSRRGNGGAERINLHGTEGSLHGSTYSTCPPNDRRWELRAHRIDVDTEEGFAVARNAVLRVGKVPVLYVPWFMFPIDDRRRTGLLFPSVANSDRNGFDYKQPIYINIAPNYDATLSPRVMTERGALLGAEFRYLNERGSGTVSGSWMPDDKLRDRERGYFAYHAYQNVSSKWQARSNVTWISDPRYFEDFNNSINGIAITSAHSEVGLYGRGLHWDARLTADHWQLADFTLTEASLPFNRLPRAAFRWEQRFGRWFALGAETEAVRFQHSERDGGSRLDFKPYVSMPLEGASWFIKPTLAWRYTGYQLDDALATTFGDKSPSRSLPITTVDAGLFFDRSTRLDGKAYLQTLEPRLFYLHVPYRNQDDLPRFDTAPLTFSWGQLFRDNRYSGPDRQTDANQLTMAMTSRLIREADGREKLAVSLGQIRYFDDSRVTVPGETPVQRGKSAWVADVSYAPSDRWTIGASYQWDPKLRREEMASFRARYLMRDEGVVNLAYRYRRDLVEQADFSFLYPINAAWSLVGRHYYSLLDHKPLETIAGVQWDSCCIAVRLVGRRYVHNREGDLSSGLMLEIELKGLGSGGQDTRKTLRRAILGYNRGDLYLVPPEMPTGQPPTDPDPTQ